LTPFNSDTLAYCEATWNSDYLYASLSFAICSRISATCLALSLSCVLTALNYSMSTLIWRSCCITCYWVCW